MQIIISILIIILMLPCVAISASQNTSQTAPQQISIEQIAYVTLGSVLTGFIAVFSYIAILVLNLKDKVISLEKQLEFFSPFKDVLQKYGTANLEMILEEHLTQTRRNRR